MSSPWSVTLGKWVAAMGRLRIGYLYKGNAFELIGCKALPFGFDRLLAGSAFTHPMLFVSQN